MDGKVEGPDWFFTAAQFWGGVRQHLLSCCSLGETGTGSMFASHPFSSPQGLIPAALDKWDLSDRGDSQAGLWPRALLPKLMEGSMQRESCPVEELSAGFSSFPAKQLFFLLHIFFPPSSL